MGITVHPVARSESVSENMKSVVRSSRSFGYLTITATTMTFSVILSTITELMSIGLISSKSITFILACPTKNVHNDVSFLRSANNTIHKCCARIKPGGLLDDFLSDCGSCTFYLATMQAEYEISCDGINQEIAIFITGDLIRREVSCFLDNCVININWNV